MLGGINLLFLLFAISLFQSMFEGMKFILYFDLKYIGKIRFKKMHDQRTNKRKYFLKKMLNCAMCYKYERKMKIYIYIYEMI